ncbi:hypothetical protein K7432_002448 [Basidiobolus ranarum]|uniref:ATP-dependent DNA ligase family profile domain-containing protein n=1 Tax=Basidiobolus ranarum TaxID=34480 RepID=A0ABR2W888_9FUNG
MKTRISLLANQLDRILLHSKCTPTSRPNVGKIRQTFLTTKDCNNLGGFFHRQANAQYNYPSGLRFFSTRRKCESSSRIYKTSEFCDVLKANDQDLGQLLELQTQLKRTQSITEKIKILESNRHLFPILTFVSDPKLTFGLHSKKVRELMNAEELPSKTRVFNQPPRDLLQLLKDLSSRKLTGLNAIGAILSFLNRCCSEEYHDVVYDIIDRDLGTGVGAALLNRAKPGSIANFKTALAESLLPSEEKALFLNSQRSFYASRKLDGIRCLTFVSLANDPSSKELSIRCFSRRGNEFSSLSKVVDSIRSLISTSNHMDLVQTLQDGLVLDGEICVFKDGRSTEGEVENFQAIMREITRNEHQVRDPLYFVFDVLTQKEYSMKGTSRRFSERLDFANQLFKGYNHPRIKLLEHTKVKDFAHLQQLKSIAFERRWEGLMLRRDTEYEGKRSRNLLKIKQWEDEEFIVEDIQKTRMNLVVRGSNEEREILGSVIIRYKNNKVNVGSGFTLDQRIRYAADPSLIIGKPITVQYYSETEPSKNKKASSSSNISLRFPTVKAVYESGTRDT